jgi:hypothetical protein
VSFFKNSHVFHDRQPVEEALRVQLDDDDVRLLA